MVRVSRRVGWVADIAADPLRLWRGPIPALAARRGWSALRTVRPGRQSRRERGGPVPPRVRGREGAASTESAAPVSGEFRARGAVKLAAEAASHLRPRPFLAEPEPVATHRRGGNAPGGGPAGSGGRSREGILPHARRPRARRVESPGQTARTPPVYLLTVSRPVELSLQSSFQLSLTVLVVYRSRAGI